MPSSHPPSCPHKNQPGRSLPRSFASPSFSFPTPKSRRVGAKTTHSGQQAAPEDALQRQTNHGELRPDGRTTGGRSEASADSPAPALGPPRKEAGSSKTNRGPPIGGAEPPAIHRAGISPEHSQKSNSPREFRDASCVLLLRGGGMVPETALLLCPQVPPTKAKPRQARS